MINKTLLEITETKNRDLSEIVTNWQNYTEETFLLTVSELKRRNVPINNVFETKIAEFSQSKGKPISEFGEEFFKAKGVEDYTEYYNSKEKFLEKSDEERILQDKQRREIMNVIEQRNTKQSGNDVLYGGLWFFGGLLVTIISLSSGHGGIIAYGAVIFGGIQFLRGLMSS